MPVEMSPQPASKYPHRTSLWRAVKAYQPHLSDREVSDLCERALDQERNLVLRHGLNLDEAREIARADLFPPKPDDQIDLDEAEIEA